MKVTCNDDSALLGVRSSGLVAGEGQLLDARGVLVSDDFPSLVGRDVDVLVAELSLGGRGVNGLGEALALGEAGGLRQVVDGLGLLVPEAESADVRRHVSTAERHSLRPGAASNIAADCGGRLARAKQRPGEQTRTCR